MSPLEERLYKIFDYPGMRTVTAFGEPIELHDEVVNKFEYAIGRKATSHDIEKIIRYCVQ